jgi:nicotinamidase-related amidase
MKDALLVIDVIQRFDHEDGDKLLASMRERLGAMQKMLERARDEGVPVVYVNDRGARWDSDVQALIRDALGGPGGDAVEAVAPRAGEAFLFKWRYSIFDHTPLDILLGELEVERVLLTGAATEMCVIQSAIDAREEGLKVTIVADACAAVDEQMEKVSLEYAEKIVGAFVENESDVSLGS